MITTSDIWQSSPSNSNTNDPSFYFPSSCNSKQYHETDNHYFDYQISSDISASYLTDPYSHIFPNNYTTDLYSSQTVYNSISMESSTYLTPTDSYQNLHPIYTDSTLNLPSSSSSMDYQSASSQWDARIIKMPNYEGMYMNLSCSTSRNGYQPVSFLSDQY
jgi:hypothetical protein